MDSHEASVIINLAIKLVEDCDTIFGEEPTKLQQDIIDIILEWQSLVSERSPEEQETWLKNQIEVLSSTHQYESIEEVKKITKLLMRLSRKRKNALSKECSDTTTTSTSSMTVPLAMGLAGAGCSLMPDDIYQDIQSESFKKKTGEMCSSIIYSTGFKGKSYTLKSEIPKLQAKYLIKLELFDLQEVDLMEIQPQDLWRHATQKIKFFVNSDPEELGILSQILQMTKSIRSSLEKEKRNGGNSTNSQKKPKKSIKN